QFDGAFHSAVDRHVLGTHQFARKDHGLPNPSHHPPLICLTTDRRRDRGRGLLHRDLLLCCLIAPHIDSVLEGEILHLYRLAASLWPVRACPKQRHRTRPTSADSSPAWLGEWKV